MIQAPLCFCSPVERGNDSDPKFWPPLPILGHSCTLGFSFCIRRDGKNNIYRPTSFPLPSEGAGVEHEADSALGS